MCKRGIPEKKHTTLSIVGLTVSVVELIVASIYNFQKIGFGLGFIGICISCVYLYFNVKYSKPLDRFHLEDVNEDSLQREQREEGSPQVNKEFSKTTQIMMQAQMREQAKSFTLWNQIAWIIYVIFVVILCGMCLARTVCLFRRSTWRAQLDGKFPEACGDWAAAQGCTRVEILEGYCVRPEDIVTDNTIIIDTTIDKQLNKQISSCVDDITGGKLMFPDNLSDKSTANNLIHISVSSSFVGFIDDMYMITEPYYDGTNEVRQVKLQSQLRIGSSDFGQNYNHVKAMLDCINSGYSQYTSAEMPCSQ